MIISFHSFCILFCKIFISIWKIFNSLEIRHCFFLLAFVHGNLFPCVRDDYLEARDLNLWKIHKIKVMILSSRGDLLWFPFGVWSCYRLGLFYYPSESIYGDSGSVPSVANPMLSVLVRSYQLLAFRENLIQNLLLITYHSHHPSLSASFFAISLTSVVQQSNKTYFILHVGVL